MKEHVPVGSVIRSWGPVREEEGELRQTATEGECWCFNEAVGAEKLSFEDLPRGNPGNLLWKTIVQRSDEYI